MSEEKQYQIYLKWDKQWIQVTEEVQKEYHHDISAFRRKQQRHGCCNCPKSKWWLCDMNCEECEFRKVTDQFSLEAEMKTDDGTTSLSEVIEDPSEGIEELFMQADLIDALYREMDHLDTESQRICMFIMEGKSMRESARILGLPWTTYQRRWEKIKSEFQTALKDYV